MDQNVIDIVDDKILIKWNGEIPEQLKNGKSFYTEQIAQYWEHLVGHVKYDQYKCRFKMAFSAQNIFRLERQFGSVKVNTGYDRFLDIKERFESYQKMLRAIGASKFLPLAQLPKYDLKMDPLGEYQYRLIVFLCNVREAALFADCGLGKTYAVINSCEIHKKKGIVKGKTLIIAKLTTVKSGWLNDVKKFSDLSAVSLWEKNSNKKRKAVIRARMQEDHDLYIINHDGVRLFEKELIEMNFEKVVIDESTVLKNFCNKPKAIEAFGKAVCNVSRNSEWKVIMTGTPMPNTPENLWGQYFFLNQYGLFLEQSFYDFREEYMEKLDLRPKDQRLDAQGRYRPMRNNDPSKWVPRKTTKDRMISFIRDCSYRVNMKDHLKDMPPLTAIVRDIQMTDDQERHYKTMKDELRVVIDDERVTVNTKLTQLMKLRQITGGFIIDHDQVAHAMPENPKLEELDSIIENEIPQGEKFIIFAQYRWEIETLIKRYKHLGVVSVYGGNSSDKNIKNIDIFLQDPKIQCIVLHPASAAHGITFTNSHFMIFYSMDHSSELNYQAVKRIERNGQKHPMIVWYLICEQSIDQSIYKVVVKKLQEQGQVIDAMPSGPSETSLFRQLRREEYAA